MLQKNVLLFEVGMEELPFTSLNFFLQFFIEKLDEKFKKNKYFFLNFQFFISCSRIVVIVSGEKFLKSKNVVLSFLITTTVTYTTFLIKFMEILKNLKKVIIELEFVFVHIKFRQNNLQTQCKVNYKYLINQRLFVFFSVNMFIHIITEAFLNYKMSWSVLVNSFVRPVKFICVIFCNKFMLFKFFDIYSCLDGTFGNKFICYGKIYSSVLNYEKKLESCGLVIPCFFKRYELIRRKINFYFCFVFVNLKLFYFSTPNNVAFYIEYPFLYAVSFLCLYDRFCNEVFLFVCEKNLYIFVLSFIKVKLVKYFFFFFQNVNQNLDERVFLNRKQFLLSHLTKVQVLCSNDKRKIFFYNFYELRSVIFFNNLGTIYDKTKRICFLSTILAFFLKYCLKIITMSSILSKLDVVTLLGVEYPLLKGKIGKYYALYNHIDVIVSFSIEEQYGVTCFYGNVPRSLPGIFLAISDKLDTIVGLLWTIKNITDNDLFALRKQIYHLFVIIVENSFNINFFQFVRFNISCYTKYNVNFFDFEIFDFIIRRFFIFFKKISPYFEFVTCFMIGNFMCFPFVCYKKLISTNKFALVYNILNISNSIKRIKRIIHKNSVENLLFLKLKNIRKKCELQLFYFLCVVRSSLCFLLKNKCYFQILEIFNFSFFLLDDFFSNVFIYNKNIDLQKNRIYLLNKYLYLFYLLKDIMLCNFSMLKN